MMVAARDRDFPRIGKVTAISAGATLQASIDVLWYELEKAATKPRWRRYFRPSNSQGKLLIDQIVLYDFSLTKNGALEEEITRLSERDYIDMHQEKCFHTSPLMKLHRKCL